MKKISIILAVLVMSITAAFAQSAEDMEKMQASWEASIKVGEQHQFLEKMAGEWTYVTTSYMVPGKEEKGTGKATKEMVCGGRYLSEVNLGNSMGMPFEGHNTFAYDNIAQQFRSCWIDNFGTGFMIGEGQREGNSIVMFTTYPDVMGGPDQEFKITYTINSDKQHIMDMVILSPEGEETKQMNIVYTKAK